MTFQAGRFVLVHIGLQEGMGDEELGYVTSWDTWDDASAAFCVNGRLPVSYRLYDDETGRVWHPGTKHVWEDAQT